MNCLDKKSLTWNYLPSSGGYYDQDFMIMEIWEAVKFEYNKCLKDENFMKILQSMIRGG